MGKEHVKKTELGHLAKGQGGANSGLPVGSVHAPLVDGQGPPLDLVAG